MWKRMSFFSSLKKCCLCLLLSQSVTDALSLDVGTGVRSFDFRWSIAGEGGVPNILSELEWKRMRSYDGYVDFQADCLGVLVQATGTLGTIYSGQVVDTDYDKNGRKDPWSLFIGNANHGFVLDGEISLGWREYLAPGLVGLVKAGGCFMKQHLSLLDGELLIGYSGPRATSGVDSRYTARWLGTKLGAEVTGLFFGLQTDIYYDYYYLDYKASGYWNQRDEFAGNFIHEGTGGFGHKGGICIRCDYFSPVVFGVKSEAAIYKLTSGTDRTPVEEAGEVFVYEAKLNEARFRTYSVYVFLSCSLYQPPALPLSPARQKIKRLFS